MNQRFAFGLTVARSRIHGKGCFAIIPFRRNQQIAEYQGERISIAEAMRRRRAVGERCICDIDGEWAIDGSRDGNGTQYVNHSCRPNALAVVSQGRIFFHALKDIAPGEEITTDYLYELQQEQMECRCGSPSCAINLVGAINSGESTSQPRRKEQW